MLKRNRVRSDERNRLRITSSTMRKLKRKEGKKGGRRKKREKKVVRAKKKRFPRKYVLVVIYGEILLRLKLVVKR